MARTPGALLLARLVTAQDIGITRIENPGVILYKTSGPLPEARLGDDFPGSFPARFMRQAWGLEGPRSPEGAALMNATGVCTTEEVTDEYFGQAMLERAKAMFDDRGLRHELDAFLQSGVSNTDSPSPRDVCIGSGFISCRTRAWRYTRTRTSSSCTWRRASCTSGAARSVPSKGICP